MKILITGASGFIGSRLLETLFLKGHDDIRVLTRKSSSLSLKSVCSFPVEIFEWDPEKGKIQEGALAGVDVVVNLAGENVAGGLWTKSRKDKIYNSRMASTGLLLAEIKKLAKPPRKFINSSAIGIYGNRFEKEELTEASSLGEGFLAKVCKDWEHLALNHGIAGMASSVIRTGIVLGQQGGALEKMLPFFKFALGGSLGSGQQSMSWIHLDDLVGNFIFLIEEKDTGGIYNGTAPTPVTNKEFTKILGRVLGRPTPFPVPAFFLKTALGEMSQILLDGQKVLPEKFLKKGYIFLFPTLDEALKDILKNDRKGEKVIRRFQWIKSDTARVFLFFSDEKNLELITPSFLKFKVIGKDTPTIRQGTSIEYALKVRGIPFKWKSLITNYDPQNSFTDTQINGPYSKWVHGHEFIPVKQGTLIKDEIVYKLPLGILGGLFAGRLVAKDLKSVFDFRHDRIDEIFGAANK